MFYNINPAGNPEDLTYLIMVPQQPLKCKHFYRLLLLFERL